MLKRKESFIPTEDQCREVAQVLKLVAHPDRLLILCQLVQGPKTVGELESLVAATQSGVSQFLTRMRLEGLVKSRREGQFMYYEIAEPKMERLIESLHDVFCA
jgi:ArsR family transcriptional regulator, virulence genes transcriptional regulator